MDRTAPPPAASVLIVDDSAVLRRVLCSLLGDLPGVARVVEAASGSEALAACRDAAPQLVLMDVNLPDIDGIEVTRQLRQRWPTLVVVGLSVHGDDQTERAMIRAGATAFVCKSAGFTALQQAVAQLL